jgi:hypothetical protein
MACDTNICIKSMATPNPLAFSLPKQWQQSKNGTRIGTNDKPNDVSPVSAHSLHKKHQSWQKKNDSKDNILIQNYYACLATSDTDEEVDDAENGNTPNEHNNCNIETSDNTTNNKGTRPPSQASSLHVISTLMFSLFPSPVPNNDNESHGNINNNGNFQNNNGNNHNKGNNTPSMYFQPWMAQKHHKNGRSRTTSYNGETHSNKTHGNNQVSHMSMKWQPQARPIIQWTQQHLDLYLALTEVACKWNVHPG